jgi:putative ABC transport system permease protein
MLNLAWANLKRRKLRSAISVLAITFIIMMIVTVFALADGLTDEVGQRMSSVQAELIVLPAGANLAVLEGESFGPKDAARIAGIRVPDRAAASQPASRPAVEAVIPVYVKKTRMGGQEQRIYGIDPAQWKYFGGQRRTVAGRLLDDRFDRLIDRKLAADPQDPYYDPRSISDEQLKEGLQILIDKRLADVHDKRLTDGPFEQANRTVRILEHDFTIVGVVESGVIGRVFMPLATMRHIYAGGEQNSTCLFVKLRNGIDRDEAANAIEQQTRQTVLVTEKVGQQLRDDMRFIFRAVQAITGVSLAVGLGVLVLTIYTMILERRREIAILKSLGAGTGTLLRQVLTESLMLCLPGTLLGIGFSYVFATVFMALRPLDTVAISGRLWALALGGGIGVSVVAALICGASAARQNAVATLSME